MTNISRLNQELSSPKISEFLGYKVKIVKTDSQSFFKPYGLKSEYGGVYYTGDYRKVIKAAESIITEVKKYNKFIK